MTSKVPLQGEITCSVCFDVFKNPHILRECLHTFCYECITEIQHRGRVQCPQCRKHTSQKHVKKDFKSQRLVDLYSVEPVSLGEHIGMTCGMCHEKLPIRSFCVECESYMCAACEIKHKSLKLAINHDVKQIGEKIQRSEAKLKQCITDLEMQHRNVNHKRMVITQNIEDIRAAQNNQISDVKMYTEDAIKTLKANQIYLEYVISNGNGKLIDHLIKLNDICDQSQKELEVKVQMVKGVIQGQDVGRLMETSHTVDDNIRNCIMTVNANLPDTTGDINSPINVIKGNRLDIQNLIKVHIKKLNFDDLEKEHDRHGTNSNYEEDENSYSKENTQFGPSSHDIETLANPNDHETESYSDIEIIEIDSDVEEKPCIEENRSISEETTDRKEDISNSEETEETGSCSDIEELSTWSKSQNAAQSHSGDKRKRTSSNTDQLGTSSNVSQESQNSDDEHENDKPEKEADEPENEADETTSKCEYSNIHTMMFKQQFQKNDIVYSPYKLCIINDQIWCVGLNDLYIYAKHDGQLVKKITHKLLKSTRSMAYCSETDQVFVACWKDDIGLHQLTSRGKYVAQVTNGNFSDICYYNGHLYALDYLKCRVVVLKRDVNANNQWVTSKEFKLKYNKGDDYDRICVNKSGIYISSYGNSFLCKHTLAGRFVSWLGQWGRDAPGNLFGPMLCGVDSAGNILVADNDNRRMQLYDQSGNWNVMRLPVAIGEPMHSVVDENGDMFIITHGPKRFIKLKVIPLK